MRRFQAIGWLVLAAALAWGCGSKPHFATGFSADPDPAIAGRTAARRAIAKLDGAPLRGLLYTVYYPQAEASEPLAYAPDTDAENKAVQAVAAEAASAVPSGIAPSIGTRAKGMTADGAVRAGVAVLAIGGDQAQVRAAAVPILADRAETGRQVAQSLVGANRVVVVFSQMNLCFGTPADVDPEQFLVGLTERLPAGATVWGGNSMDAPQDDSVPRLGGVQFYNGQVLTDHVVAMGIGGPIRVFVNQANEFDASEKTVMVTQADGQWVQTIDNRPALEIYRKLANVPEDEQLTSDWRHALGVVLAPNKTYVRMILDWVGPDGADQLGRPTRQPPGSIRLTSALPPGTVVRALSGGQSRQAILDSADRCLSETLSAVQSANGAKQAPALALVSSCCTRDMRLTAAGGGEELADLPAELPLFGFYAYGQVGPIGGAFAGRNIHFQQQVIATAVLTVDAAAEPAPKTPAETAPAEPSTPTATSQPAPPSEPETPEPTTPPADVPEPTTQPADQAPDEDPDAAPESAEPAPATQPDESSDDPLPAPPADEPDAPATAPADD